jgi:hypothetical protein
LSGAGPAAAAEREKQAAANAAARFLYMVVLYMAPGENNKACGAAGLVSGFYPPGRGTY